MPHGNDPAVAADEVAVSMFLNGTRHVHGSRSPQLLDDLPREMIDLSLTRIASPTMLEEQIDHRGRYRPLLMTSAGVQCHSPHTVPPSVLTLQEGSP